MKQIQILKNTVYLNEDGMLTTAKERMVGYKSDEVDARIQGLEKEKRDLARRVLDLLDELEKGYATDYTDKQLATIADLEQIVKEGEDETAMDKG